MGVTIQFNRGAESGIPTLASGEPGWTTDTFKFYIGDGVTNHLIGGVTDHTFLTSLDWESSGHEGPVDALAGFDHTTGAALAIVVGSGLDLTAGTLTATGGGTGDVASLLGNITPGQSTTAGADMESHTIPGNTLATNKDAIVWIVCGDTPGNSAVTRTWDVYFDGTLAGSLVNGTSTGAWTLMVTAQRLSGTHVLVSSVLMLNGGSIAAAHTDVTVADLTSSRVLKVKGTSSGIGSATGDIATIHSTGPLVPAGAI